MAKTDLTAERLRELLYYDPDTGVFTRRIGVRGAFAGTNPGYRNPSGNISVSVTNKLYLAHRLAWLYVHGAWPKCHIDHINGNPSDNRLANLRDVSRFGNLQNMRGPTIANKSGFLGVSRHGKNWRAEIMVNRMKVNLGTHKTPELASQAYLTAKRLLHSTCTI